MKHKRLNRDSWGFMYYPYYQMHMDTDIFKGEVCLIKFTDGEANYWDNEKAGRLQVTGEGMTWMQLIPESAKRLITVMYFPDGKHDSERHIYPSFAEGKYQPSVWYVDVAEGIEYDEDGVLVYIDKYLDVIFIPEGEPSVSDRDELDEAYKAGDITREQYESAIAEGDAILRELCEDIPATPKWCAKIREWAEARIAAGEPVLEGREIKELKAKGLWNK